MLFFKKIYLLEEQQMKMKRTLAAVLAAAAVGTIGVGSALADVVDQQDTEVGIGFVDAHIPGQNDGDLQLRWVPKKLDFGKYNDVNSKYTEFKEVSGNDYYVVVRDTRPLDSMTPTTDKWKVSAKLGEIKNADGTKEISKAQLSFTSVAKGYEGEDDPNTNKSTIVENATSHATAKTSKVPTVKSTTTLEPNKGTEVLMSQDAQGGAADWAASLEDIKLGVSGKQGEKGTYYSGTLTWTLEDTL